MIAIGMAIRVSIGMTVGMSIGMAIAVLVQTDTAQCGRAAGSRSPTTVAGAVQRLFAQCAVHTATPVRFQLPGIRIVGVRMKTASD